MRIIKLTQGKETIIDDEDYEYLNQWNWCYGSKGYAISNLPRINGKRQTLRMHRLLMNCSTENQVDHINGNKLDNRKANLRIATQQQNSFNKKSFNKFKGARWHKLNNKFISSIKFNGVLIHLGYFHNEEDAAKAYDKAALFYFGEFAKLNFPE